MPLHVFLKKGFIIITRPPPLRVCADGFVARQSPMGIHPHAVDFYDKNKTILGCFFHI